jgi:hypothetical protein
LLFLLLSAFTPATHAVAQQKPPTVRDFLTQYLGREVLLLDKTSNELQFDDPDSTRRFVVVLDDVGEETFIVHRGAPAHETSYRYSLSKIRRITYLFNGRPYQRIVIESY